MASVATNPVHASLNASVSSPAPGLASEVRRISLLISGLENAAGHPVGNKVRESIQAEAATCAVLLRRISQLENSKADNLDTALNAAGLLQAMAHDSEKATTTENLINGAEGVQALFGLLGRISNEMDLSDLRKQYREAAEALQRETCELYAIYAAASGDSLPKPGFMGIMLEGNKVVSTTEGSAARSAGIKPGDTIREINGQNVEGLTTLQVLAHVTGNAGQLIKLRFKDAGPKTLELRRLPGYSKLGAEYHSSMNGTFYADHLRLSNLTQRNLTNCLIRVRRLDGQRNHSTRLHYCKAWPAGGDLHFGYRPSSDFAAGEAFDQVETIEVSLISDQFQEEAKVDYSGAVKEADYRQQFEGSTISYSMLKFEEGIFFDDNAGVRITLASKLTMNPSRIRITFSDPGERDLFGDVSSKTIWWEGSKWRPGEAKSFRDARFNGINPRECSVEMEFPHTTYKPQYTWKLR